VLKEIYKENTDLTPLIDKLIAQDLQAPGALSPESGGFGFFQKPSVSDSRHNHYCRDEMRRGLG